MTDEAYQIALGVFWGVWGLPLGVMVVFIAMFALWGVMDIIADICTWIRGRKWLNRQS